MTDSKLQIEAKQQVDSDTPSEMVGTGAENKGITALTVRYRNEIAAIGAIGVSIASGLTNLQNGWDESLNAGVNQLIFSGASAALLLKIHHECAQKIKSLIGEIVPIIVPITVSISSCYAIHDFGIPYLKDASSEPALSTIPTAILISLVMPFYHYAHSERLQEVAKKIRQQFSEQCSRFYEKLSF